jgi:hypothetical protein
MPDCRPHPFRANPSLLALVAALGLAACDRPPATAPAGDPAQADAPKPDAKKDDVKMSKELWPNGKLKYTYEMRRGASGKWDRNGIGRAYYDTGELEREGTYKDGVRVGQWKYFKPDGTIERIEERGADGKGGG